MNSSPLAAAIPGWRDRLILDAYGRMPNGEGQHKTVVDSYVDLAETRGHSLPGEYRQKGGYRKWIESGFRSGIQRLSSDSTAYRADRRPDFLYRLEKGRWGIRPLVLEQIQTLETDESLTSGGILTQKHRHLISPTDAVLSNQDIYMAVQVPSRTLPVQQLLVKFGLGNPPARLRALQTGNPQKIELFFIAKCINSVALDNKILQMVRPYKTDGGSDWGLVPLDLLQTIGGLMLKHSIDELLRAHEVIIEVK